MICPRCGQARTKVLETRSTGLLVRRRSACDAGHRWTTIEVPETVVKSIGSSRLAQAIDTLSRGVSARQEADWRRETAVTMLQDGKTVAEVAEALRVTEARVRQIRSATRKVEDQPQTATSSDPFNYILASLGGRP
jgi:transcriptional regulator NrdR family protein